MPEHYSNLNFNEYKSWPRPMTEAQLAQAVVQSTVNFALEKDEEGFTPQELSQCLEGQFLLPYTDYFAGYFTETIMQQAVNSIEEKGGAAQWNELDKTDSRRYYLECLLPDQESEDSLVNTKEEASSEENWSIDDNQVKVASFILDKMQSFRHEAQYLVEKTLPKNLGETGLVVDEAEFKKVVDYLCDKGVIERGLKEVRKRGGFIKYIKWKNQDMQRAWRLQRWQNIQNLQKGESFKIPPKSRKERRASRRDRRTF